MFRAKTKPCYPVTIRLPAQVANSGKDYMLESLARGWKEASECITLQTYLTRDESDVLQVSLIVPFTRSVAFI